MLGRESICSSFSMPDVECPLTSRSLEFIEGLYTRGAKQFVVQKSNLNTTVCSLFKVSCLLAWITFRAGIY